MRKIISVILVVFISFSLFSCSGKEITLSYDIDAAPINLDPQSAYDYPSKLIIGSLFEGLLRTAENGEIECAVAEKYTVTNDGLTYNFVIKEDVKWSDGTPVTAHDFVFSFVRLFDATTNSKSVNDFFCILNSKEVYEGKLSPENLGVTALSDRLLQIKLSEYNSRFLYLLTTAPAMPCNEEFFLETKGKYGLSAKMICANGPFYLNAWKEDYLKLVKNAEYIDKSDVKTDEVIFNIIKDEDKSERFINGKTSALATDSTMLYRLSEKGYNISYNENTTWGILFKTYDSPFANGNIRKALMYDCDYSSMEAALPEYYALAMAIVPPNIRIGEESYRTLAGDTLTFDYNPETAKELYQKGLKEIDETSITKALMIVPKGMGHEEYSAYIPQIWQKDLGLYLTVETLEPEEYAKRLAEGSFDCAVVSVNGDYNSPYAVLSYFTEYLGGEFNTLLKKAAAEPSQKEACSIYKSAEEKIINEGVFLPLYYQSEYFITSKKTEEIKYDFDSKMVDFRMKK